MPSQTKKRPKARMFIALALFLYLLPNAVLNVIVTLSGNKIAMYYHVGQYEEDVLKMEQGILKVIPAGTNSQRAKRLMWMNGFACSKQTNTLLQFKKNDGWFPTYEGTAWFVDIELKNGLTSKTKVWIQPND
jgi:hypothetical protein